MLTSNRKFGVEIEFVAPSERALNSIAHSIHCEKDGSLRPLKHAAEYVSPILKGDSGELSIRSACEVLKKHGASGDNPKTSVHVHLDGMRKQGVLRSQKNMPKLDTNRRVIAVSNKAKKDIPISLIQDTLVKRVPTPRVSDTFLSKFEGITFISKAPLTRAPRINYTYYWIEEPDRFKWVRNVFYFYTQYSKTLELLVSNSRRFGNMYCIPLHKSYELPIIEATSNMDELRNVWYKGRGSTGHYDDSRYHNVNLHCFWDRHGTVEIRCHGGTIDPDKVLLWVALHQKIVDKLEDMELDDIKFTGNEDEMLVHFLEFVEEPLLQEYVRRLVGFYSNKKIK